MEITAHIICIGNEIMLGHITNSNAQYISKTLSSIGIKTTKQISIPDDSEVIIDSIKSSLEDSNTVVITGGLGPTVDDLTLKCISKALNRKLIFKKRIANHIKAHFKKRGLKMPPNNLRQAFIPEGAVPILNNIGTAPGLLIPFDKKIVIAFPGVPFELYPMLEKTAVSLIKNIFSPDEIIKSRIINITGLPESKVNEKIEDILKLKGRVQMGIYPHPEQISIKITVTGKNKQKLDSTIEGIEKAIRLRLGNYIFGYDNETLEEIAGKLFLKTKKTLSIAESCTGGLLSSRITNIPGSSRYFKTGVIVYSDSSKNELLDIPSETIKRNGAVSKKVALLLSKNIRILAKSDIGIGISGIAGPGGGTKKKPVGLVYIALSTKTKNICKKFRFLGQRGIIKYKATQAALDMLRKSL